MSRPDSPHVTSLKAFRERLVDARRGAALEPNIDTALRRFTEIETAIALVDKAIEDEADLTPIPRIDDPTVPPPAMMYAGMMMLKLIPALAIVALIATPVLAERERPTARSSGVQAVHTYARSSSGIVDKLDDQERVYLTRCTKQSEWCRVQQLDGGPPGWVLGSYLIGSQAKLLVTPYEFSFDPMDPLGLFPDEDEHHPF